jgi:hypothetical protein
MTVLRHGPWYPLGHCFSGPVLSTRMALRSQLFFFGFIFSRSSSTGFLDDPHKALSARERFGVAPPPVSSFSGQREWKMPAIGSLLKATNRPFMVHGTWPAGTLDAYRPFVQKAVTSFRSRPLRHVYHQVHLCPRCACPLQVC